MSVQLDAYKKLLNEIVAGLEQIIVEVNLGDPIYRSEDIAEQLLNKIKAFNHRTDVESTLLKEDNSTRTFDGTVPGIMPVVNGKTFICSCGCNVFHKPYKTQQNLYCCNACGILYEGE